MRDEIMRLADRMSAYSRNALGTIDAQMFVQFAGQLRALSRTDHVEDKLGMVADGWREELLVNIKRACIRGRNSAGVPNTAIASSFVATCDHIENMVEQCLAAAPAPDHSAGVGGMVASIDSAPKNKPILISDGVSIPDVVQWHAEKPAHDNFLAVREGWFSINGGRSRFCTVVSSSDWGAAKVWAEIPAGLSALAQPADADGGK